MKLQLELQIIIFLATIAAVAAVVSTTEGRKRGNERKHRTKKTRIHTRGKQDRHRKGRASRFQHASKATSRATESTVFCSSDFQYTYKNQTLTPLQTYKLWHQVNPNATQYFKMKGMTDETECEQVVATTMAECGGSDIGCKQDITNNENYFGPWQISKTAWNNPLYWHELGWEQLPPACVAHKNACCSARLALAIIKYTCIGELKNAPNRNGATPRFCASQWQNNAQDFKASAAETCRG